MVQVPKIMESWDEAEALIRRLAKDVLDHSASMFKYSPAKTMEQCQREALADIIADWWQNELQDADAFGIVYCWPGRDERGESATGEELGLRLGKMFCEDEVTRTVHNIAGRIIQFEVENYLKPGARDLYPKHLTVRKLN